MVQLRDIYQQEIDENLYLGHVSLKGMFSIYSNLTRLFSCPEINWILRFDELKTEEFREYIERILSTEFRQFTARGKSISNDLLTELMDKMPDKATIVIDSNIRSDYSNPKALRFRSVDYKDARWLKLEDLFSIRNSYIIKLKRTNFDCSDLNEFIHYWSDCEEDMIGQINITLKEETRIDKKEILKNFITICNNKSGSRHAFIKARNMGNRKRVVGKFEIFENEIRFSAWDPFKEDYLYEYLVLKLVHQKRSCEEKIRKMENEYQGLRKAEKRKFQLELKEFERKLAVLNRDFDI
ncbi:hypothetical protein B9Z55_004500 [Caenorhabditis nigoni]|nr:hypothetical protein B9Z55_004500 [Caenorhabditis nigoni]